MYCHLHTVYQMDKQIVACVSFTLHIFCSEPAVTVALKRNTVIFFTSVGKKSFCVPEELL